MKYFASAIKVIWLSLSILILYFSLHRLSQLNSIRDISELISIMSYGMILISFPTGLVFIVLLFFLSLVFNTIQINIENKYIAASGIWFFFLVGGYIQWFYLMKKLLKN